MKKFIKYIDDELPDGEDKEYSKKKHAKDLKDIKFRLMFWLFNKCCEI